MEKMTKTLVWMLTLLGMSAVNAIMPFGDVQAEEPKTQTEQTEKAKEPAASQTEQGLIDALKTRLALVQAKVAALEAKVALEIDKLSETAGRALDDADARLSKAKETATAEVSQRIDKIREDVRAARDAVTSAPGKALTKIDELVDATQQRIEAYKESVLETDEAKLLKKQYAELEAQASLLNARLAEKADETGKQALSYLEQAKGWYTEARASAAKEWAEALSAISERIDAAREAIKRSRAEAAEAIMDLSKSAADLVRGSKEGTSPKESGK